MVFLKEHFCPMKSKNKSIFPIPIVVFGNTNLRNHSIGNHMRVVSYFLGRAH